MFVLAFILSLIALVISVPIFLVFGLGSSIAAIGGLNLPWSVLIQVSFGALTKHVLIAVPLFIFSGMAMLKGGAALRLVKFATTLVGHWPGGLGVAMVIAMGFFAAFCGSILAAITAVGKFLPNKRTIIKIETFSAVKNIDNIFNNCNEILIDRGDLAKDVRLERVPFFQREIQRKAKRKNKKVYIATNLLETMVKNSGPTRAEINDIYNCLELGAHALVLAAETAIGKWPLESVNVVSKVIKEFERVIFLK